MSPKPPERKREGETRFRTMQAPTARNAKQVFPPRAEAAARVRAHPDAKIRVVRETQYASALDASQPGSEYIVRAENFFARCKTCTANQGTVIIIGAIGKANADAHAIIHLVVRRGQGTNAVDIEFPK